MKPTSVAILAAVSLFILFCATDALSQGQKWQGSGNWGAGNPYNRLFNPDTMVTFSGEVTAVNKIVP
ncbi:MAG: DNA-binding protein, partial [Nanoarchaeota archaeon]|nr:DNA-binding protein [Nanoarchaeota archaeon]